LSIGKRQSLPTLSIFELALLQSDERIEFFIHFSLIVLRHCSRYH